jgi:hypothetical protein
MTHLDQISARERKRSLAFAVPTAIQQVTNALLQTHSGLLTDIEPVLGQWLSRHREAASDAPANAPAAADASRNRRHLIFAGGFYLRNTPTVGSKLL